MKTILFFKRHVYPLISLVLFLSVCPNAFAQYVPLAWQGDEFVPWSRDKNLNRIDDIIDPMPADETIDVVIDLNRYMTVGDITELIVSPLKIANNYWRAGKYIPYVYVEGVKKSDILALLATSKHIALVEYAIGFELTNDISVKAIKARKSPTYSPNTVQDKYPAIDGSGVRIAIFDSGVDDQLHESFTYPNPRFYSGYDFVPRPPQAVNPDDEIGHGTAVAGTALGTGGVSGTYEGVAPGAELVDIRILKMGEHCGTRGLWNRVALGLEWIIANGRNIRVVNMSFRECNYLGGDRNNGLDAVSQMVDYAAQRRLSSGGAVMVAAADNDGGTGFGTPGAASRAITVGATNDKGTVSRGDDAMTATSNLGPRANDGDSNPFNELKPEISAPGANITSAQWNTTGGYTMKSGTSMAAPHVAGVAALILQKYPGANALSVKNLLTRTAEDVDPSSDTPVDAQWNNDWGYGYLDAFWALDAPHTSDVEFPSHASLPGWLSPDLALLKFPILAGEKNAIIATVANTGAAWAYNVTVNFGVYIFSASVPVFYPVGTQRVNIPPNDTLLIIQEWIPKKSPDGNPHSCLYAEIGYGLDQDYTNNTAQRNIDIVQTGSPAVVTFQVSNILEEVADITLEVNKDSVPVGWNVDIKPGYYFPDCDLTPAVYPKVITVTFVPPPAADPGKIGWIDVVAKATTFSGTTQLGGVRVGAVVTLAKNFLGDVNGDQSVNSTDANIVLTREVGIAFPLQYPITCGDVNADGKIDSTDALIILSFDAKIPVPYGIQKDPCK